jgi:hypothetical protein
LVALISKLDRPPSQDRAEVRKAVRELMEVSRGTRELALHHLQKLTDAGGARDRILAYLKSFVGEIVEGEELFIVSAISEYPRRIRELRVEYGYNISTGNSRPDLKPDQYILEKLARDEEAAKKWKTANSIRRRKDLGARQRILKLFQTFPQKVITGEQLAYVALISEWPRRVRELRTELGWRIATQNTGRPDLSPSEYVLESTKQLPQHDRKIPDAVYVEVLERDKHSCRKKGCGWSPTRRIAGDRRQFIEVHHIEHHKAGGANTAENLITLCNVHHDEAHRREMEGGEFFVWLKGE